MTRTLIYIFIGGGTGSVLCYCVQTALSERMLSHSFPWVMFTVNLFDSFLIGLFYALSALSVAVGIAAVFAGGAFGRFFS